MFWYDFYVIMGGLYFKLFLKNTFIMRTKKKKTQKKNFNKHAQID
jgi:hypothetical protein